MTIKTKLVSHVITWMLQDRYDLSGPTQLCPPSSLSANKIKHEHDISCNSFMNEP